MLDWYDDPVPGCRRRQEMDWAELLQQLVAGAIAVSFALLFCRIIWPPGGRDR